jgi:thiol-disulfide isomerase/thioredoxin
MILRRCVRASITVLVLLALGHSAVAASGSEPYTEARFSALQQQGALVLVDLAADWCPTCAKQAKAIQRYREARPTVPLHVLRIDFDAQKEWVKYFKAPRQSTLILYRGSEQVWFSVAETDAAALSAAIDAAAHAR